MASYVERLLKVVPPPKRPREVGSAKAWQEVELKLGVALPDDFKRITTHYGRGQWQQFWFLLNPFTKNLFLNLCRQCGPGGTMPDTTLAAERYIRDLPDFNYPHPIYPERGGILPWAITDNGGRFFWLTKGSPSRWKTVYYADRSPEFDVYNMSCSALLYGAVTGRIPIFTEEFGDDYEYGKPDAFVAYQLSRTGGEPMPGRTTARRSR